MGTTSREAPGPVFAARSGTAVALVAAGVTAGVLALMLDPAGRILFSALALVLLSEGLWLLLGRPVLAVHASGLTVRDGFRLRSVDWSDVHTVEARPARRVIASATLELELGDRLVVIPAYRLGVDPELVATSVAAARPATHGSRPSADT